MIFYHLPHTQTHLLHLTYLSNVEVEDFGEFDGSRDQPSDETRTGTGDITPGEFYQLKMAHGGGDPFPMTATFEVRGCVESLPTIYCSDVDNQDLKRTSFKACKLLCDKKVGLSLNFCNSNSLIPVYNSPFLG